MGLAGLVFLGSCGKDDEPRVPDALEGTWALDAFQLTEAPAGFESYEGLVLELGRLVAWEDYEITFAADNTYSRRIFLAGPDNTDEGVWTKEGTSLNLKPNEEDFEEDYTIETNSDIELIWSEPITLSLIEDAVRDTLSQAYVDSLTDEEFDALFANVDINLNFIFDKQ